MDIDTLTTQLLAEADQPAPQPTSILDDIWKTETRNEAFGQELSIALAARDMNQAKLESIMIALKENWRMRGPIDIGDALRQEIAQRMANQTTLRTLIDRCQTMLELSMSLLWERWGDAIEEFLIAEKGLRILREALASRPELGDGIDEESNDDDEEEKPEAEHEVRAEMRRVMEDIESAAPALRIFKRVLRRYKKQQNPDEAIPRITFEKFEDLDDNTTYLHDWERMFEEGIEMMDEQVVRKWVEDLRPRG